MHHTRLTWRLKDRAALAVIETVSREAFQKLFKSVLPLDFVSVGAELENGGLESRTSRCKEEQVGSNA